MKKIISPLSVMLLVSGFANAQFRTTDQRQVAATPIANVPVNNPAAPTTPPAVMLPGATNKKTLEIEHTTNSAAEVKKKLDEKREISLEIEKRLEMEHSKGMISLNFGIVKQGESIMAFCPFNIATLSHDESIYTPSLSLKDLIRTSYWNNPTTISNVQIGVGPFMTKLQPNSRIANGQSGNGFYVTISPTNQLGLIDETITIFTTQGNISYALKGYVYAKDGATTVSK